ncbi:electron transfer flavoprotein subunit beta/FixA family protein [Jatrophihabitans sp. DSM 45814]
MRVVVCVKQVPDPGTAPQPSVDTSWLVRADAAILDDTDRFGVELGLQLIEGDGSVNLVSMGPATSDEGIRQGLAMGAEKAILVREDPDRGADVLTTARALSSVIAEEGFDLVITGTASTDGSAGVMCQMLGEMLQAPSVSGVTKAEVSGRVLTVHRQTRGGYDVVTCNLPAVISITAGAVEPRYPNIKGVLASKRKQVARRDLADLLDDWPEAAWAMPRITAVMPTATRKAGQKIEDNGSAHLAVISVLEEQGII